MVPTHCRNQRGCNQNSGSKHHNVVLKTQ